MTKRTKRKSPFQANRGEQPLRIEKLEDRQLLTVVINEIHYNPDDVTEQVEFIELHNAGDSPVDLSGWRIDDAVDFTFSDGATLAAGEYLVVTQDASDFQIKFGVAAFGQWEEGDRLSNDGETIELLDAIGAVVDEVSYRPGFPWPTTGVNGSSLELINPNLDNDLSGSWRSSGTQSDQVLPSTLIERGSVWRYRKGITANPPSNPAVSGGDWRRTDFNEANDPVVWQNGVASIGYGDGDDETVLSDMRFNYSSFYARRTFTLDGPIPNTLELDTYLDDGAIIYLNGVEVERLYVSNGDKDFDDFGFNHEARWETTFLTNVAQHLVPGENTLAVHVLNATLDSSDASFNLGLATTNTVVAAPTPGARNSVAADNAAPQLRQLKQSVKQPRSGEDVTITIKATDPDGVQGLTLEYQVVEPGQYVRITDAEYGANWTSIAMRDDGLGGDLVAGDDIYTVVLPGDMQEHRHLVRYRISAEDTLGASITAPYADDLQPNFAYFVYDGVPDYEGSFDPRSQPDVTYSGDRLDDIATYHLIADSNDINNSQYNSQFNRVLFRGTVVYNGEVYDHVEFRNRGVASTYQVGKNKWKIEFLDGHKLQAHDNYGNPYNELWDEINVLPGTNPWWRNDISTEGTILSEAAGFKLYELAGTPSPKTNFFNFRVIDGASETGANQYDGDFWGLYIGIEQPDGSFLNERGLDDGNIYNLHTSVFGRTTQRTQGANSVTDRSDLAEFISRTDGGFETLTWWEENLNWDSYFAWSIINFAINNSDIRPNENVNYYRNEVTGEWHIIPWDLDLTFEDADHLFNPLPNRERLRSLMAQHPEARIAYENRLREITDLLLGSGDAARVIEELANIVTLGGDDLTIVHANQAQWDFHPRKVKRGIWYDNFNPALLKSQTFDGLVEYMQDFVSPGGYGYNQLQGEDSGALPPNKPVISYIGAPGFSVDQLAFQTTRFTAPQSGRTFANMEWRISEVHNASTSNYDPTRPYVYEIEGTWESGTLSTFDSQLTIAPGEIEPGSTYRARVRMQDNTGRWSHWSDPIEFLAEPPSLAPKLAVTELHYHPSNPDLVDEDDQEFIEIMNIGATPVSLDGVQIADFASNPYVFDDGLTLDAGERIVVARTPSVFESVYGTDVYLAPTGYANANLSNGGETITLLDQFDQVIVSFTYDDRDGWAEAADGDGPSLEMIDPLGDPSDPGNWRASLVNGGSPGTDGSMAPLPGDYDGDGVVAQADHAVWVTQFGTTPTTPGAGADGNGDGVVDAADYSIWRDNLGATSQVAVVATSLAAPSPAPITEPAAAIDEALESDGADVSPLAPQADLASATYPFIGRAAPPSNDGSSVETEDAGELALRAKIEGLLLVQAERSAESSLADFEVSGSVVDDAVVAAFEDEDLASDSAIDLL